MRIVVKNKASAKEKFYSLNEKKVRAQLTIFIGT